MSTIKEIGKGLIIAAPRSGAGKTTVMLGLCKAFLQKEVLKYSHIKMVLIILIQLFTKLLPTAIPAILIVGR